MVRKLFVVAALATLAGCAGSATGPSQADDNGTMVTGGGKASNNGALVVSGG